MDRWGIIYSPKSGVVRTHRRWERIRRYLNEKGVEYDFVQSEGSGSEERLAAMLAKNGYTTIIIVGGDGALNRAVNGVLSVDPELRKTITFGLIPNGRGNDYAKFWGLDEDEPERSVDWLIQRRVRQVDLGLLRVGVGEDGKATSERYFLNCVNVGLVAKVMSLKHKTYRFWGMSSLSYLSSMLLLFFQVFRRLDSDMSLNINHEHIQRKLLTACVGNCHGYGQTPNAVPYNGMLDVTMVSHPPISQIFHGMGLLFTGRFLNHRNVVPYRTRSRVVFHDIGQQPISADGQVLDDAKAPLEVSVRQEWIQFIIPS